MPDPLWYVLGQIEIPVRAANVTEALMKGQAEIDRIRLMTPEKPSHEALKWMAWRVEDE